MLKEPLYHVGTLVRFISNETSHSDIGYIESVMSDKRFGHFYSVKMFSDGYVFKSVSETLLTSERLLG